MESASPAAENFFVSDRGERGLYIAAAPNDTVLLPVTRDGFEALVEICSNRFSPALPVTDSMRSVVAGYVHHLTNEVNTITIDQLAKVMFKSISNALTWTIDQEVKQKRKAELEALQAKMKADHEEAQKKEKLEAASEKREKKSLKKVTLSKRKGDETQRQ